MEVISGRELLRMEISEPEFVVECYVPAEGITYKGGKAGIGKTFIAIHIAVAVATGTKFMGKFKTKKGAVLYIDEENGLEIMKSRLKKIALGLGIVEDELENIYFMVLKDFKISLKQVTELEKIIQEKQIKLIIIDSLVRVFLGDENSATDVRTIFNLLKSLCHEHNLAVIILHHSRKTNDDMGQDDLRGSSDIAASATSIILIGKERSGELSLTQDKLRIGQKQNTKLLFQIVDTNDSTGITLQLFESKIIKTVIERAKEAVIKLIGDMTLREFSTTQMKDWLKEGHSGNSVNDAVQALAREKILESVKTGYWKVIA